MHVRSVAVIVVVALASCVSDGNDAEPRTADTTATIPRSEQACPAATPETLPPSAQWQAPTVSSVLGMVMGSDDVVYVAADALQALRVRDGCTVWTSTTGAGFGIDPAASVDAVAAGSADGHLRVFDAVTGEPRWSVRLGQRVWAPTLADDVVYARAWDDSESSSITALDLDSGEQRWQQTVAGRTQAAPALTARLVLAGSAHGVVAMDRDTGEIRWSVPIGRVNSTPVAAIDTAYVATQQPGDVVAIDLEGQRVLWRSQVGSVDRASPVVVGDAVVVATVTGGVAAIDVATGTVRWEASCGDLIRGTPAVHGDVAIVAATVGRALGRLCVIGLHDGEPRASLDLPSKVFARVIIHGNLLLVGTWEDGVLALRLDGLAPNS